MPTADMAITVNMAIKMTDDQLNALTVWCFAMFWTCAWVSSATLLILFRSKDTAFAACLHHPDITLLLYLRFIWHVVTTVVLYAYCYIVIMDDKAYAANYVPHMIVPFVESLAFMRAFCYNWRGQAWLDPGSLSLVSSFLWIFIWYRLSVQGVLERFLVPWAVPAIVQALIDHNIGRLLSLLGALPED